MTICVIMHNMIVEDERSECLCDQGFQFQGDNVVPEHVEGAMFAQYIEFHHKMHDWETHMQLQNDLVEHI